MQLTIEHAKKINELLDHGLVQGLGKPVAGSMCVEAAVCFALGLPHSDNPPCVGAAVRQYKIRLNDSNWSSNKARAEGMRRVAIAQLGSDTIDQRAFADHVLIQGVRRILPIALRAAAKCNPEHADTILATVPACEAAASINDARLAASHSKTACRAAAAYAAYAAYAAAAYAAYAADAAAAYAYAADAADAAAAAAADADAAAYAAAAADYAAADYAAADAARDSTLSLAAEIAVEALQAQNSPGCAWLDVAVGDKNAQ